MKIDKRPPLMAYLKNPMIYRLSDIGYSENKVILSIDGKEITSYSTMYINNISIDIAPIIRQLYNYDLAIGTPTHIVTFPRPIQDFEIEFAYGEARLTFTQNVAFGRAAIYDKQADRIENYTCYDGLPFTFDALFQTPQTIGTQQAIGLNTIKPEALFINKNSLSFPLGEGFQFTDQFTPEFHMSGTAMVNVVKKPIPVYDWIYLKWLNNHGGTNYHLFKKIGSKTKVRESTVVIDNINYNLNSFTNGVNEGDKLIQPKESRQTTLHLVSLQTTYQEAERLRTLVSSDVVYMHTPNGWYRVQVATTDFETPSNNYSDLPLNIVFND